MVSSLGGAVAEEVDVVEVFGAAQGVREGEGLGQGAEVGGERGGRVQDDASPAWLQAEFLDDRGA
jgi:hypothetical protein